ncbi:MAG TPA: pyridoxal 5'-phosphate synthase glutaminase subunit PdxT [Candidatus Eisenbacteria bacterium]|jgi:5'-phosphate synthase pdxT subunit
MSVPRVGVLALQGDFARHLASLEALGVDVQRIVRPEDLADVDALVLPGGESTTMTRLLDAHRLREPLTRFAREQPVLGTCAGLILLGRESERLPGPPLGVLDATVERNGYGRQVDSFTAEVTSPVVGGWFPGVFIRAPRIRRVGPGVEVIAHLTPGPGKAAAEPVGVRRGQAVGLCFHPELTGDLRFHRWFLGQVAGLELPGSAAGENGVRGAAEPVPEGTP